METQKLKGPLSDGHTSAVHLVTGWSHSKDSLGLGDAPPDLDPISPSRALHEPDRTRGIRAQNSR